MEIEPPKVLKYPLKIPHKILMGPGPSNASPRILQALTQPILGHMHPELFEIMDEIKQGIQYIFQTNNEVTFAVSGFGHAGMETVISNLIELGDKVLILSNGIWGERAADMVRRHGGQAIKLNKRQPPNSFDLDEIERAIKISVPKLLFVIQGESSTGIYQSLEGIGEITRRYNVLLAVDAVASAGAVPLFTDKWQIDAIYTGSQKIIGAPPGMSPISFGSRAMEKIRNRKTPVKVYCFDVMLLGQQWNCFEKNQPRLYHHTTCGNLLYSLREGLAIIAEEKLENVIKRHQACAKLLYDGLSKLNLECYIEKEGIRLPSVTTIKIPEGVDAQSVISYAMKNYNLEISGGLGPTVGKVFRIGLMGYNATELNVRLTLKVLKEAIANSGKNRAKL